jgi:hypothetical protein
VCELCNHKVHLMRRSKVCPSTPGLRCHGCHCGTGGTQPPTAAICYINSVPKGFHALYYNPNQGCRKPQPGLPATQSTSAKPKGNTLMHSMSLLYMLECLSMGH